MVEFNQCDWLVVISLFLSFFIFIQSHSNPYRYYTFLKKVQILFIIAWIFWFTKFTLSLFAKCEIISIF